MVSTESIRESLKKKEIWEIPYYHNTYMEDNDSEDEIDSEDENCAKIIENGEKITLKAH